MADTIAKGSDVCQMQRPENEINNNSSQEQPTKNQANFTLQDSQKQQQPATDMNKPSNSAATMSQTTTTMNTDTLSETTAPEASTESTIIMTPNVSTQQCDEAISQKLIEKMRSILENQIAQSTPIAGAEFYFSELDNNTPTQFSVRVDDEYASTKHNPHTMSLRSYTKSYKDLDALDTIILAVKLPFRIALGLKTLAENNVGTASIQRYFDDQAKKLAVAWNLSNGYAREVFKTLIREVITDIQPPWNAKGVNHHRSAALDIAADELRSILKSEFGGGLAKQNKTQADYSFRKSTKTLFGAEYETSLTFKNIEQFIEKCMKCGNAVGHTIFPADTTDGEQEPESDDSNTSEVKPAKKATGTKRGKAKSTSDGKAKASNTTTPSGKKKRASETLEKSSNKRVKSTKTETPNDKEDGVEEDKNTAEDYDDEDSD